VKHLCEHPTGIETGEDFLKRVSWIFEEGVRSKFGAMRLDELDEPGPEHSWLVNEWFSDNDISVLAGVSQSGKTFIALELALDIAENRPFFGMRTRYGGVVYQAGEAPKGVKKRLRAWRQHHERHWNSDVPFVLLQKPIDIYHSDEGLDDLIKEIIEHSKTFDVPLRLVVIDTFATATIGADENSGKDMSLVLRNVATIRDRCQCHVLLVHHLNANASKLRGHTSVYANSDQVVLASRDDDTKIHTLVLDKAKEGERGKELKFELPQIFLGINEDGDKVTSCVVAPVGEKEAIRREEMMKGLRLTSQQEIFMRCFFEADRKWGGPVPPNLIVPTLTRSVVPWETVKNVFADKQPSDVLTPDAQTTAEAAIAEKKYRNMVAKRIQRLRDDLLALEIIGIGRHENEAVAWWTGKALRAFPQTQPKPQEPLEETLTEDIEF
jgi:hypothetical protein